MIATLSYVSAHWFLILSVVLGVVGLGAFAWFAKNWKAALAAVVLVMAGLFYQSADLAGYKRAVDEAKAEQIKTLTDRLAVSNLITAADTHLAMADAKLNTDLETLSRETPYNGAACLDVDAARRVRAIGASEPVKAPVSSRRSSKLLPWRGGRP